MNRKPIQFQDLGGDMIVLCDDGTIWRVSHESYWELGQRKTAYEWVQIPNPPQPEDTNE